MAGSASCDASAVRSGGPLTEAMDPVRGFRGATSGNRLLTGSFLVLAWCAISRILVPSLALSTDNLPYIRPTRQVNINVRSAYTMANKIATGRGSGDGPGSQPPPTSHVSL